MRVLITGNMGYVGPKVLARLRRSTPKAHIVGLDLGYFAHCLTGAERLPECDADVQLVADVRAVEREALAGVDAVVHLAAISNDPMGNVDRALTLDVNARATVRLAALARDAGVRAFAFASSCSVYGFADGSARDENAPLNPLTAYAESKVTAEEGLVALAGPEFRVTCLRFATACGMSPRLRLDLVLNDFAACAVSTGRVGILSDGTPWRPLIHVEDMARALEWAILRERAAGGDGLVVNVGANAWNHQVRELAEAVREAVPGTEVSVNPDAAPDRRSYRVSFDRYAALAPAHQPRWTLARAVGELVAGLRAMGFRDADFRSSQWIRLRVLARLKERGLLGDDLRWIAPPSLSD